MRILIADDDLTSRAILTTVLERSGHEVAAASGGAEAWVVLQSPASPPLAILDWIMPDLDGAAVCRLVRARETNQPPYLILLTTRGGKHDIVEGLRAGANDYLTKPFDAMELLARVEVGCRMLALQAQLVGKVQELEEAIAQIQTLRGILPICAWCKKIRDDAGYWSQVENYVTSHSLAKFSHGLCPDCSTKYFPDDPGQEPPAEQPRL